MLPLPPHLALAYAEILLELKNSDPSSAIAGASYDPVTSTATFSFTNGTEATHALGLAQWEAYRNSPSKGGFYNTYVRGR